MHPPTLPKRIANKQVFSALWTNNRLGSKLQAWSSIQEIPKTFKGLVMIRQKTIGGGIVLANVPISELGGKVLELTSSGVIEKSLYFNECAPDQWASLQGEVVRLSTGLCLFAAIRKTEDFGKLLRMRDVLPYAKHYHRLQAKQVLQQHCSPTSYDDLSELLDLFPDHVIEFTAYARQLEGYKLRNVIIWEVRLY